MGFILNIFIEKIWIPDGHISEIWESLDGGYLRHRGMWGMSDGKIFETLEI